MYKKDSEKWREEVLSLKELINKHKNEILQVQPDLHNILKSKDDRINELTSLVDDLRVSTSIFKFSRLWTPPVTGRTAAGIRKRCLQEAVRIREGARAVDQGERYTEKEIRLLVAKREECQGGNT